MIRGGLQLAALNIDYYKKKKTKRIITGVGRIQSFVFDKVLINAHLITSFNDQGFTYLALYLNYLIGVINIIMTQFGLYTE